MIAELITVLAIPTGLVAFYVWLLQSRKGTLPITTTECAYDRSKYGHILNWDKHCLSIHGTPTLIFGGEFHYWRLPDQSRWESILKKYRAGGFNCIRIYFHWGFHNPDQGIYKFDDNRDIDYLLNICEKLEIYVLAAPGPYICAETQVGGFPLWLAARKYRIRNIKFTGFKEYDKDFAKYEKEWFEAILPILARHQITKKSDGCVIALQVENELFDKVRKIPFGLHDEMRFLCKVARDCEITVPFFSNDPDESGSFIAKPEDDAKPSTFFNRRSFGLDLYGFDKYFIFTPPDSPVPFDFGSERDPKKWKPWDPKSLVDAIDHLEREVRSFGHDAAKSPIFIPELQGGWYTSYKLDHTFDDVYNFYGDNFTRIVYDSVLAQGCNMFSFYMVYGGTNWGTIGDIDGTTSYDYSACIRESGYISGRLRNLRLGLFFVRSFSDVFAKTERVERPNISASVKNVFNLQRRAVVDSGGQGNAVVFTFLRNFSKTKSSQFRLFVNYMGAQGEKKSFDVQCYLPYKSSFIALGNYVTSTGLKLIFSSIPIHLRILHPSIENDPGREIWIIPVNNVGELAFEGEININGSLRSSTRKVGDSIIIVSFSGGIGYAKIKYAESSKDLIILALDDDSLGTLHAAFDEPHWAQVHNRSFDFPHSPSIVSWGTQNVYFDLENNIVEVEYGEDEKEITILSLRQLSDNTRVDSNPTYPLPFIYKKQLTAGNKSSAVHTTPELLNWSTRITDFSEFEWRSIDLKNGGATENHYTSGHVLYRAKFTSMGKNKNVQLNINMRHRCTIFVNGKFAGGHMTFNKNFFFPGAKMGPEIFAFLGGNKYDITKFINHNEEDNIVIILVDNLGISRQSVVFNDARNKRGLISAKISGISNVRWEICGVDVRRLEIPFLTSGIPDEHKNIGWSENDVNINEYGVIPDEGIKWWSFEFRHPVDQKYKEVIGAPLRLVLYGAFTSYIFLNGTLIGRYYGNGDNSQHDFYLMDGLLNFNDANQIKLMVYGWEQVSNKDIKVEVRGWEIDEANKSGNIIRVPKDINDGNHDLKSWIIMKEKIKLNK